MEWALPNPSAHGFPRGIFNFQPLMQEMLIFLASFLILGKILVLKF